MKIECFDEMYKALKEDNRIKERNIFICNSCESEEILNGINGFICNNCKSKDIIIKQKKIKEIVFEDEKDLGYFCSHLCNEVLKNKINKEVEKRINKIKNKL
jgi:hypothetical protein